jgi:hypothetical protein
VIVSDCALVSFLLKVSERVNTSEIRQGEFAGATEFGWAADFPKCSECRGPTENGKNEVRKAAAVDGKMQVGMTKSLASEMQLTVVTDGGMGRFSAKRQLWRLTSSKVVEPNKEAH